MDENDLTSNDTKFIDDENYNVNDNVNYLFEKIWENLKKISNFDLKEFINF